MGGDNPAQPVQNVDRSSVNQPYAYLPHFGEANKYLPSSYSSSSPVYDPSAILNAYMAHLPQFQKALQPTNNPNGDSIAPVTQAAVAGKSGGKSKGPMDYLDPIGSSFFDLF